MTHIAVTLATSCPACGAVVQANHALSYYPPDGGGPHYSESVSCGGCGYVAIADGGEIPPHVREAFLREHGCWRVDLVDAGGRRLELARELCDRLGLSRADALRIMNELPAVLRRATRPEAEKLADDVRRVGGIANVGSEPSPAR